MNSTAGEVMLNAYHMLQHQPYFRQQVRHYTHKAVEAYNNWERWHTSNWGSLYLVYLDYLSEVDERTAAPIKKFVAEIKVRMDEDNVRDSELLAQMMAANVLLEYSCNYYEEIMNIAHNETKIDFRPATAKCKLTAVYRNWDNLLQLMWGVLAPKVDKTIHLDQIESVREAFANVVQPFADSRFLLDACKAALRQNGMDENMIYKAVERVNKPPKQRT